MVQSRRTSSRIALKWLLQPGQTDEHAHERPRTSRGAQEKQDEINAKKQLQLQLQTVLHSQHVRELQDKQSNEMELELAQLHGKNKQVASKTRHALQEAEQQLKDMKNERLKSQ